MLQHLLRVGCGNATSTPDGSSFIIEGPAFADDDKIDIMLTHNLGDRNRWPHRTSLVFIRDPFECAASWYKLDWVGKGNEDTFEAFKQFAFDRVLPYWCDFVNEYILTDAPGDTKMHPFGYNAMLAHPQVVLTRISKITGFNIDIDRALQVTPVRRMHDHKLFPYYENQKLLNDMKRALGPWPALVRQRGLI